MCEVLVTITVFITFRKIYFENVLSDTITQRNMYLFFLNLRCDVLKIQCPIILLSKYSVSGSLSVV